MPKYSPSSYDEYFCLKPPFLLWVAALFLSRAIALPLAVGLSRFAGVSSNATDVLKGLVSLETLLPSALAAAVLFAMIGRSPKAPTAVRWIWARGRRLLAAAALIDCALSVYTLAGYDTGDTQVLPLLVTAALDVYFLFYLLLVRRVRDTFAQFPLLATSQ